MGGFGAGRGRVISSVSDALMSSSSAALPGKPLAMAEFDVCCDMDRGSFDLS